jgi:hypothetical protein
MVDDALYEFDEPRPSESTIRAAKNLIDSSSALIHRLGFEDADIHPADGAIRIIWTRNSRTLKAIFPPLGEPYLFHKDGREYASEKATKESLSQWLTWLSGASASMSYSH